MFSRLHANEAARHEASKELRPERLGLGLSHVQADDLAAAGLVHHATTTHLRATRPPSRTFSIFAQDGELVAQALAAIREATERA